MNLLSGQTVFLTAVVTKPMRYIAVDREDLRQLLFEDGAPLRPAALRLHPAPRAAAAASEGIGIEIVGPRDSARDPATWSTSPAASASPTPGPTRRRATEAAALVGGARPGRSCRWCACPAAPSCAGPSNGELSRALGIGLELGAARGGRPARPRRRPGRPRRRRLRRLRGPRHAAGREHRARRPGRHLAPDRELPRLPGRDQRHRADQPRGHPGAQVRRPHGDPLPGRGARARRRAPPGPARGRASRSAPRAVAARDRRRIPPPAGRGPRGLRGASASSTPPARPRRSSAAPSGSASSAAATRPRRPPSGWPAAAPWSPSCTAAPTCARRCPTT